MPMKRRLVPVSAVLAAMLALAPPGALAQDTATTPTPAPAPAADPVVEAFQRADTDRDGRLSRQEAERLPTVGNKFQQYDDNRDGYLSLEEYRKGFPVAEPSGDR